MAGRCPPETLDALLRRSRRQGALERGIFESRNMLKMAKRACGIQEEPEADQVVTTYHLLRLPRQSQGNWKQERWWPHRGMAPGAQ